MNWGGPRAALASRLVGFAISVPAALINTRLIIEHLGPTLFAVLAIALSVPIMLGVLDVPLGYAATTGAARRGMLQRASLVVLLGASTRAFAIAGGSLTLVVLALLVSGAWPRLLGIPSEFALISAVPALVLGFAMVSFVGNRALIGADRTSWVVLQAPVVSLLVLVTTVVVTRVNVAEWMLFASPGLAQLACTVGASIVAARALGVSVADVTRSARRRVRTGLMADALAVAVGLGMITLLRESGRLLLAHGATPSDVAEYSVAYQVYRPATEAIAAGGMALWARATVRTDYMRRPVARDIATFAGLGLVMSMALFTIAPLLTNWMGGSSVRVGDFVYAAFSAQLIAVAATQPWLFGLIGGDSSQNLASASLVSLLLGGSATLLLIPPLGAAAPALGVSIGLAALIPSSLLIRRGAGVLRR